MRPAFDLSVYLVTDPSAPMGVVETAVAAVRGGATVVQLRDKTADRADFVAQGRALVAALAPFSVPLIVNDRVDTVAEIGAAGAHVGQSDMDIARARALIGPDRVLGLSIETVAQLDDVDWDAVDHVGASPVFGTPSKPDHAAPLGLDGLAAIVARAPCPVVGIGGLGVAEAGAVKRTGAAGMAVISAICAAPDPELAARAIATAWRQA